MKELIVLAFFASCSIACSAQSIDSKVRPFDPRTLEEPKLKFNQYDRCEYFHNNAMLYFDCREKHGEEKKIKELLSPKNRQIPNNYFGVMNKKEGLTEEDVRRIVLQVLKEQGEKEKAAAEKKRVPFDERYADGISQAQERADRDRQWAEYEAKRRKAIEDNAKAELRRTELEYLEQQKAGCKEDRLACPFP